MNDEMNPVPQGGGTNQLVSLRNLTLINYALYILSMFGGITALVAIIINYIKRDEVRGTYLESHFDWQIRTFWWGFVGVALSFSFTRLRARGDSDTAILAKAGRRAAILVAVFIAVLTALTSRLAFAATTVATPPTRSP